MCKMSGLALWMMFSVLHCVKSSNIRTTHYTLQKKSVRRPLPGMICSNTSVIPCAVRCFSSSTCTSFSVGRGENYLTGTTTSHHIMQLSQNGNTTSVNAVRKIEINKNHDCSPNLLQTLTTVSGQDVPDITLHQACELGKLSIVQYILSRNMSDINSREEKGGKTPVMVAAVNGDLEVFDFLVSQGCDLSIVDDYNDNVLHMACEGGNVDIVRRLIVCMNYDIDSRGTNGLTPVLNAALFGYKDVVVLLAGYGCNLTVVDENGENILHLACAEGNVELVKYVLSKKVAGLEDRGSKGKTPVIIAAGYGNLAVIKYLVRKGCNLKATDVNKNNILHVASEQGYLDLVKYVLSLHEVGKNERGETGKTAVMKAALHKHVQVVKYLISKGCDVTMVDAYKANILHAACEGGEVDVVDYVLSLEEVGIEDRCNDGKTPVMIAAKYGHIRVVKYLVSKGCNLKAVDDSKNTILHVACDGGIIQLAKYLINLGVIDRNKKNKDGLTPVDIAIDKGYRRVVALLKRNL